jgi:hypothetical protein
MIRDKIEIDFDWVVYVFTKVRQTFINWLWENHEISVDTLTDEEEKKYFKEYLNSIEVEVSDD